MRTLLIAAALMMVALATSAQDIDSLERALEKARFDAPLVLKPFVVLARPAKYYGDYEPRADNVFRRGELLTFYIEPKNLVHAKNPKGLFEPAFEVDLEVRPPKGDAIRQPGFASFRLPGKSRVQDIFLNLTLNLGDPPPGNYNLRFTVRDLNSNKRAAVEQVVTIK